jgi:hypothetical protein
MAEAIREELSFITGRVYNRQRRLVRPKKVEPQTPSVTVF